MLLTATPCQAHAVATYWDDPCGIWWVILCISKVKQGETSIAVGNLPSKLSHDYGKSPLCFGKSTTSMAIFNSYVKSPERTSHPPLAIQFVEVSIHPDLLKIWSIQRSDTRIVGETLLGGFTWRGVVEIL